MRWKNEARKLVDDEGRVLGRIVKDSGLWQCYVNRDGVLVRVQNKVSKWHMGNAKDVVERWVRDNI